MCQEFIHYLRRNVRSFHRVRPQDPWYAELQKPASGFKRPQFHVTRAVDGPAAKVVPGDRIWIIAQLYSDWGVLPPAVDARIEVDSVRHLRQGGKLTGFRFKAAASSRWFPLADASAQLRKLKTVDLPGTVHPLATDLRQPIGSLLQRPRKLVSGVPLAEWEHRLDESGFDFISYRLWDGTQAAFRAAQSIVSSGGVVWWDRWSLPRRLAERREYIDSRVLKSYLYSQISAARRVLGISTPFYDEPNSYCRKEKQYASKLGKFELHSQKD